MRVARGTAQPWMRTILICIGGGMILAWANTMPTMLHDISMGKYYATWPIPNGIYPERKMDISAYPIVVSLVYSIGYNVIKLFWGKFNLVVHVQ